MCGRYVSPDQAAIERFWDIRGQRSESEVVKALTANYNTAPTQRVPVLRVVREVAGGRELAAMRWGLVPFWARGKPPDYSTINARAETIETAASYRGPWQRGQRCIMPMAGFYEWQVQEDTSKQPYYIQPSGDGEQFAVAGLWETSTTDDGEAVLSCTIITMAANELMAAIHNTKARMPLILLKEDVDTWLGGTADEARSLIRPYPAGLMRAHKVSKRVNTPKNNDAALMDETEG